MQYPKWLYKKNDKHPDGHEGVLVKDAEAHRALKGDHFESPAHIDSEEHEPSVAPAPKKLVKKPVFEEVEEEEEASEDAGDEGEEEAEEVPAPKKAKAPKAPKAKA